MDLVGAVLKETLPGDNCGKSYKLVRSENAHASPCLGCSGMCWELNTPQSHALQEQHLASVAGAYGESSSSGLFASSTPCRELPQQRNPCLSAAASEAPHQPRVRSKHVFASRTDVGGVCLWTWPRIVPDLLRSTDSVSSAAEATGSRIQAS